MLSAKNVRQIILEQSKRANVGHIGSCLSIVDILVALYGSVMRIPSTSDPDRDRLILSKGHAALALYAVLFLKGWINQEELNSFHGDDSIFGVHPEPVVNGIDFATGSLGQGLTMAVGAALAAKVQASNRRIFVVLSDAECNEGSVWEAAMFASHHKLGNLTVILDCNGQQALGYTKDVMNITNYEERWSAFGWNVCSMDGHDIQALEKQLNQFGSTDDTPHFVIAKTTFGKGVSFMNNKIEWHYLPMSDEQYAQALEEVNGKL